MKSTKLFILTILATSLSPLVTASVSSKYLFMAPGAPINGSISAIIRVACAEANAYVTISNGNGASMVQLLGMTDECKVNNAVDEISFVQSVPISNSQSGIYRSHCINNLKFISYSPKGKSPVINQTIKNGEPEAC
jgi:hypothetical protein